MGWWLMTHERFALFNAMPSYKHITNVHTHTHILIRFHPHRSFRLFSSRLSNIIQGIMEFGWQIKENLPKVAERKCGSATKKGAEKQFSAQQKYKKGIILKILVIWNRWFDTNFEPVNDPDVVVRLGKLN